MRSDSALVELLHFLRLHGYRFTTSTPATHAIVLAREFRERPTHRDVFGWNRPFARDDLEPLLFGLLEEAGALKEGPAGSFRSTIRVASLGDDLFAHSAFPTNDTDAVFFGPDTYRFVRFVHQHLPASVGHVVDMGAGTGAGGIAVARLVPCRRITLVDVNANALRFAQANAAAAGLEVELVRSGEVPNDPDLIVANPPYMMDDTARTYRDGGGLFGGAIALDWIRQGLAKLQSGGTILLYTGAACVGGRYPLLVAIERECRSASARMSVEEIDPDVFGEELVNPNYEQVERIAALGINVTR